MGTDKKAFDFPISEWEDEPPFATSFDVTIEYQGFGQELWVASSVTLQDTRKARVTCLGNIRRALDLGNARRKLKFNVNRSQNFHP